MMTQIGRMFAEEREQAVKEAVEQSKHADQMEIAEKLLLLGISSEQLSDVFSSLSAEDWAQIEKQPILHQEVSVQ